MIAKPMTDLLKKDKFCWNEAEASAFSKLKQPRNSVLVLVLPNFEEQFVVESDTSGKGLGAVLMQSRRPIAFFSHSLSDRQQLKSVYEREVMAIVFSI